MTINQNIGTLGSPQNIVLERQVVQNTEDIKTLQDSGVQIDDGSIEDVKLSNEAGQIKGKVQILEANDNAQDASILALTAGQSAQDSAIANNASGVALNASNHNALESRVDLVEAKDTAQDGRLDAVEAKDTAQDGRLDAIEAEQVTQNNDIDALENRADLIEAEQVTQNGRITQNETDIANITVGATQLIGAFSATNPQDADLEIILADDFVVDGVYFIKNPKTLSATGMTISKDAGVTKFNVVDEVGAQVNGSNYNDNDSIFVRFNTTNFVILTPQSVIGFETRLATAESNILDLETDVLALQTNKLNKDDVNVVYKQTGALPASWTAQGNIFYADITLVGFTVLAEDRFDISDNSLDEVDLALVQSAGIFNAFRQTDSSIRLLATANVDLSSVDYLLEVTKDGGQ